MGQSIEMSLLPQRMEVGWCRKCRMDSYSLLLCTLIPPLFLFLSSQVSQLDQPLSLNLFIFTPTMHSHSTTISVSLITSFTIVSTTLSFNMFMFMPTKHSHSAAICVSLLTSFTIESTTLSLNLSMFTSTMHSHSTAIFVSLITSFTMESTTLTQSVHAHSYYAPSFHCYFHFSHHKFPSSTLVLAVLQLSLIISFTLIIPGKSHITKLLTSHFVISEFRKSLYCGLLFDKSVSLFRDYQSPPTISIPKENCFLNDSYKLNAANLLPF